MTLAVHEHDASLAADPERVVARLFLPGEGLASTHSRAAQIVDRVMSISDARVEEMAHRLVGDFERRHADVRQILAGNARAVSSRVRGVASMTSDRALVLGATFTAEYAVEGAALCNPSAVAHPDQSGLGPGELRVAVALRAIGEGHVSSIEFGEAIIGAGVWTFGERLGPLATATVTPGVWQRDHLRSALEHEHQLNELSSATLDALPERFTSAELEKALLTIPTQLMTHRDSQAELDGLRHMVSSAYEARFDATSALSQRVLLPVAVEEDEGMEDARFVRVAGDDGRIEYRATYTAYDGSEIAPRLITSPDLSAFAIHRLSGSAARNKGMALFPRTIDGVHLALTRSDGQTISLARSTDGFDWGEETVVHAPVEPWELVQTGNCGSPIETDRGWLVLTHGVGPLRSYAIGALLLARDDPTTVVARTTEPILRPAGRNRNGYVPNVVYSCGGIVHEGTLWVPYGIGDARVGVFSVDVEELLDSLATA